MINLIIYIHMYVPILFYGYLVRKKKELPQEDKMVQLRSYLLNEMFKPSDLKEASEKLVTKCLEVLCLLAELFDAGECYMVCVCC